MENFPSNITDRADRELKLAWPSAIRPIGLRDKPIEFVLPCIFKAYPREWAVQFLEHGTIYFTNLEIFKRDEDVERGDLLEGTSVTIRQGVKCTAHYSNPIFVFCTTMETEPDMVLSKWQDRDTVLQITDTFSFINRVKDAFVGIYDFSNS